MRRLLTLVFLAWPLFAATPVVLYTDLDSGPKTGGQNGNGVFLTIYGRNFGASRGSSTVTIGGGAIATYTSWADQMIVVEPGASAASGAVVVTVNGAPSNSTVSFTVRSGNIYFVGPAGSNSNAGTFASPWLTLVKCRQTIAAGDTCYALDGLTVTTEDGFGFMLSISSSGTAGNPKAIVAYPGATVTFNGVGNPDTDHAIGTPTLSTAPFEYWTIAKLHLYNRSAFKLGGRGWRVVGNELQCEQGDGPTACAEGSKQIGGKFLGNEVHKAGCGEDSALTSQVCAWNTPATTTISTVGTALTLTAFVSNFALRDHIKVGADERYVVASTNTTHWTLNAAFPSDLPAGTAWQWRDFAAQKTYHSVYYSTDSTNVEIAYNYIHDNLSCRGIQFHSSPFTTSTISTASNASPIILTFASHPNQVTGERLLISGVTGNSGANGTFFVKFTGSTTAELWQDKNFSVPTVGTGAGTGGTAKDGTNQFDLYVHDNLIVGQTCDGINFATVDPSLGDVWAYNNVVVDVGRGASDGTGGQFHPPPGPSVYAGIDNNCITNVGPAGTGISYYFNNTIYNAGSIGGTLAGSFQGNCADPSFIAYNNILYQGNSQPYLVSGSVGFSGDKNLFYPAAAPGGFTNSINLDPLFISAPTDLHIGSASPAKDAGMTLFANPRDFDGVSRPQSFAPDLGAYEIFGSLPATGRARAGGMIRGKAGQ